MTERPILFNDDMVLAILRGQKTQTRRPVKPQPDIIRPGKRFDDARWRSWTCPFGTPGDRLWVKETFAQLPGYIEIAYRADFEKFTDDNCFRWPPKWRPSIHMPRALSRITLEITDAYPEQVQDITEKDAWAEGMEALDGSFNEAALCATAKRYDLCVEDSRCIYAHLWDSLYAKRGLGWDVNPWIWVVKFKRTEAEQCKK